MPACPEEFNFDFFSEFKWDEKNKQAKKLYSKKNIKRLKNDKNSNNKKKLYSF